MCIGGKRTSVAGRERQERKKTEELYSESGAAGKRKKRRGKKAEVTAEGSKTHVVEHVSTWKEHTARGKFVPTISADSRVRLIPVHLRHRDDSKHASARFEVRHTCFSSILRLL